VSHLESPKLSLLQGNKLASGVGAAELGLELVDFVVSLDSHEELCQRLVHDHMFRGKILGARFFKIGSNLELDAETGHGRVIEFQAKHPFWGSAAESIQTKSPQYLIGSDENWLVVPLFRGTVPIAIIVLSLDKGLVIEEKILVAASIVAKFGSLFYFLVPKRRPTSFAASGLPANFSLSDRHHSILKLMSEGLSNRQIGQVLLLSESTVRQENIKIFKHLGVRSRNEAVKQALNTSRL
jgi:DNA-binding CsgD family transcriptional regulator